MNDTKFTLSILILICVFFCSGCNTNGSVDYNIVAEYGDGQKITYEELNKYVHDWFYDRRFRDKPEAYREALKDMLKNQMKRVDFFENHLDTNKTLIQSISRQLNEEIIGKYFDKQYLGKYTNDEFAEKVYKLMDKRVVYQEIILKKPEDATKSELAEIEKKALDIKSEIENGADFGAMVLKYSQDTQSIQNNGYASPVAWKQSIYDPVGNAVFNLKKNEIRILSTNNDYRIVKVAEITKIQMESFEKIKNKVIDDIKEVYMQKCLDEYNEDKNSSMNIASIKWNDTAIQQLIEWSEIPDFYENIYEDTLTQAIAMENKVILTYKNDKVNYKEYLRLLKNVLTMNVKTKLNKEDIKKFIIDAVTTDKMIKKADSLGFRKEVFNENTKNPVIKNRLVYLYNQAEIEQKIPPLTEENLFKFFKQNEVTIFYQLEKRNIYVIYSDKEQEAKNTYDKINAGMDFETIAGRHFVKTYIKERDGSLRTINGRGKPLFGEKSFRMKLNEVSEPVKFMDEDGQTRYAILKCANIRPAKQLTYEEAKNTIDKEFKAFYREKIEAKIEQRLAEKYHPEYYYDVLSKMISFE